MLNILGLTLEVQPVKIPKSFEKVIFENPVYKFLTLDFARGSVYFKLERIKPFHSLSKTLSDAKFSNLNFYEQNPRNVTIHWKAIEQYVYHGAVYFSILPSL